MHFLVKNRVRQRLDWLRPLATDTIAPIADISWFTVPDYLPFAEAEKGDFRPFAIPTQWGAQGPQEKAYFRLRFSLPKSAKGKRVILRVKSGGEGVCLRRERRRLIEHQKYIFWPLRVNPGRGFRGTSQNQRYIYHFKSPKITKYKLKPLSPPQVGGDRGRVERL